jgi:hypothetical protein
MSDLSVFLKRVGSFFESFTHSDPAVQQSVQGVGANLTAISGQVQAILPHLVDDAANAALALVPGGVGTAFDPIVDAFINQVIAAILAKKPTATTQG